MTFSISKPIRSLLLALMIASAAIVGAEVAFRYSELHDQLVHSSRYRALPHAFKQHPHDPEVVFLGDSRIIHGVVPEQVESLAEQEAGLDIDAYNLAVPGAPPLTHYAWTGHLLERDTKPTLVVLYWSEYMFGSEIEPGMSREALPSVYRADDALTLPLYGVPLEDAFWAVSGDLFHLVRFRRPLLAWLLDDKEIGGPAKIEHLGYDRAGRVSAGTQKRRARGRARGYRKELSPPATVNEEQLALFEATIRRLKDAGVDVLVMTTPASRPLWENYSDRTIYPQIRRRVVAKLDELGVAMVDYRDGQPIADTYFADGDHLNPEGALRYTTYITRQIILPRLVSDYTPPTDRWAPVEPSPGCQVMFDFEQKQAPRQWRFKGSAFGSGFVTGAQGSQQTIRGGIGLQLLNSFDPHSGDRARGSATSPLFELDADELRLLVAGGSARGVRVELVVGGKTVRTARGDQSERLRSVRWDVSSWRGQKAQVRLVDQSSGDWGHIEIDQIELCERSAP